MGRFEKLKKKTSDTFKIKTSGKESYNAKSISIACVVGFSLALLFLLYFSIGEDTSFMAETDSEIPRPEGSREGSEPQRATVSMNKVLGSAPRRSASRGKRSVSNRANSSQSRKYKATQVISREGGNDLQASIPMGTNLIGKLLTTIDTREAEQFYKVYLPYGGKFMKGAEIPKGSTLFGKIRYEGKGNKVFITFSKGIYPDGKEFEINAQALSTKDYSPGVLGDYHGKSGMRIASALGLSAVSGATAILTEREELGQTGAVAPKVSLKNAMYGGLSEAASTEVQRQMAELNESEEYVTVDAGRDLIVNLTGAFKSE